MSGQCGPIPISRAATLDPQMPASQGYIGTGGAEFRPTPVVFVVPGPIIGTIAPTSDYIGAQWAPGQGGDTPGGGGAATRGETVQVQSAWIQDGLVVPPSKAHVPGTVGWIGSRRSRA